MPKRHGNTVEQGRDIPADSLDRESLLLDASSFELALQWALDGASLRRRLLRATKIRFLKRAP